MLAVGMGVCAQETQTQTPSTQDGTRQRERVERMEKRRERMENREGRGLREGRERGMGHLMRELNLTEEQRQQSRAIMQRRLESTKLQREELFKLREKRIAGTSQLTMRHEPKRYIRKYGLRWREFEPKW